MTEENQQNLFVEKFPQRELTAEMREKYLLYAMSVIKSRALPDVRDGLKPVHRRILFAMKKLGLVFGAKFRKSATVVGEVLGKYHPHGDASVYDAMVRMAQDFAMRYPLVLGQGNFGSLDGDSAAAMRYTEAKMQKISGEILADLEKDTVDFVDNYDGSQTEPFVLPSRVPNLLLNGTTGIAVGMATNIPPHNLREVCEAVLFLSKNPDATIDDLMEFVKGPDFPTGGKIYGKNVIREAYATGRGSIKSRGRAEITEEKGKQIILISEIPYQVNKAVLVQKIAELVQNKTIVGISNLRDESNRKEPVRIVVELKRDAFGKKILNQIYKLTLLQTSFGCNFIALCDGGVQPRLLDLKTILEEFLTHRKVVIRRRTEFELRVARARAHILDGLKKALDFIDEIIELIKKSETKEIAKENLMKFSKVETEVLNNDGTLKIENSKPATKIGFSAVQADAILAMRLSTLAGLERQKIENELKEKLDFIADCEDILAKPERILEIFENETKEVIEKYGDDRRTEIVENEIGKFSALDTIPNEEKIITVTRAGWIKRIAPSGFRTQGRGGKGLKGAVAKDDDEMWQVLHSKNHNNLLFFTNFGRVFRLPVFEIPETSRTAKGQSLQNFLQFQEKESITAILDETATDGEFLFFCTKNGVVKKTAKKDFENVRKTGLIACKLRDGDRLSWVSFASENDEILIATHEGKSIHFAQKDVRSMGRAAAGVRGIRLKKDDFVVECTVVPADSNAAFLVVMENGLGKSTATKNFRLQNRGGGGIKCANLTAKTGRVAGAKILTENFTGNLMLTAQSGQSIIIPAAEIPTRGRATQGVILMRLSGNDKIVSVGLIAE